MHRSREAFWWSLFSAGGVVSALFVPVLVLLTGFILPFLPDSDAATRYQRLSHLLASWPARGLIFVILFLSFFHCAHRIRHLLSTVGLRLGPGLLAGLCYGAALAGALVGLVVLAEV